MEGKLLVPHLENLKETKRVIQSVEPACRYSVVYSRQAIVSATSFHGVDPAPFLGKLPTNGKGKLPRRRFRILPHKQNPSLFARGFVRAAIGLLYCGCGGVLVVGEEVMLFDLGCVGVAW